MGNSTPDGTSTTSWFIEEHDQPPKKTTKNISACKETGMGTLKISL